MADNKLSTIINSTTPHRPAATPSPPIDEDVEDVGPCAAIAKNKWVTALTIKHAKKPWESFQYHGIDTRSTFEPTRFELLFVGEENKWRIVVTGRNLEKIYNLAIQHRLEWLRAADRDFAQDGKPMITGIEVEPVAEKK